MVKNLLNQHLIDKLANYYAQLKQLDLLEFNRFLFKQIILQLFRTENILPFIVATCAIGFSITLQASEFIFIPQTSIAAFGSFFIFTVIVSIITLVLYPVLIIFIVNFGTSFIKGNSNLKNWLKMATLLIAFIFGAFVLAGNNIDLGLKIQLIVVWMGLYHALVGLYLTHLHHQNLGKISNGKIIFIVLVIITMSRPLVLVFLHISEALNFTNINTQVYLDGYTCRLLYNLNGNDVLTPQNSIFTHSEYFKELPNNQGCYLYGNTIRYSFAYDFVLVVKKNINPLISKHGKEYNEYVRLSCYAGNCYSENNIYYLNHKDIYATLIQIGRKFQRPL